MMNHPRVLARSVLALMVAACGPSSPPPVGHSAADVDSAGIGAVRDQLSRSLVAGNVDAVMAGYTDSAVFVGQGTPTIANRGPMTDFLKAMYASAKVSQFDLTPVRVIGHDGMLTETGIQYEVAAETGKAPQQSWGRYMLTWVGSAGGKWQVAFDMAVEDSTRAMGKAP